MDYKAISPEAIGYLYKAHQQFRKNIGEERLLALAELRVSQLNGCAFCCGYHAGELRQMGISQEALDELPAWKLSGRFHAKERLVLQWAEEVTAIGTVSPATLQQLEQFFSQQEVVDITAGIALMNALNRIRITLGDH